jgi:Dimethyladenosine transferase (rRNA methylation)
MGIYDKLRRRLDKAGVRPSIRRGQNFLLDGNMLRFIAETGALTGNDVVLEVGPGTGFLTRHLAKAGPLVLAVELDRGLLPIAKEEVANFPNVFFIEGDILAGKNRINPEVTAKLEELLRVKQQLLDSGTGGATGAARLKSVANLPYSAGTPLVMNMLSSPLPWELGVFLLQKEVVERIVAKPGGKEYGAISISAALASVATLERVVPPNAFWPRPNVDSAVVRIAFKPLEDRLALPWVELRAVTNAVFGSRRKILKNALKGLFPDTNIGEMLEAGNINPESRGEQLPPEAFLTMARLVGKSPK